MVISKGIQNLPSKDLIYGVEGVGKSSLASTYPKPIFFDIEGSTTKLDIARLEVRTFDDFKNACRIVCGDDGKEFETVVIDTTDWLENVVINQILKDDGAKTITDKRHYGFGMGDKRIEEFFRVKIIPSFEVMISQGKNIVLVSHAHIKGVDDPVTGRYDHYTLKMGKTASAVLREWVNNIFFMNYDQQLKKDYGIGKDTVLGGKTVCVYTQRTPQYNAKRRDKLADKIKFVEGINPYPQIIGVKPEDKEEVEKPTLLEVMSEQKEEIKEFKKES